MSKTKAGGSSKNGRDSTAQRLGAKVFDGQFVNAVVEGRSDRLTRERVLQLADGRVHMGEEARKEKLIDELGNYEAALKTAARLAGIEGEPYVVTPPKPRRGSILDLLTKTDLGGLVSEGVLQAPGATLQFEYLGK